jgi:hypothetical protein
LALFVNWIWIVATVVCPIHGDYVIKRDDPQVQYPGENWPYENWSGACSTCVTYTNILSLRHALRQATVSGLTKPVLH